MCECPFVSLFLTWGSVPFCFLVPYWRVWAMPFLCVWVWFPGFWYRGLSPLFLFPDNDSNEGLCLSSVSFIFPDNWHEGLCLSSVFIPDSDIRVCAFLLFYSWQWHEGLGLSSVSFLTLVTVTWGSWPLFCLILTVTWGSWPLFCLILTVTWGSRLLFCFYSWQWHEGLGLLSVLFLTVTWGSWPLFLSYSDSDMRVLAFVLSYSDSDMRV